MSKSEILYVKGMNVSESEGDDEDVWDDKKLNDAYDKALRIANAEVAKRVAMSTNTQFGKEDQSKPGKGSISKATSSKKKTNTHWKVGMPCRAVYEGDGLEYEAFVIRMINDKECVVRFLGYENSEIVLINTLKPTLGNDERTNQIEQALNEKTDDGFASQSPNCDMEFSDRVHSPESLDTLVQSRKKSSKKKKSQNQKKINAFDLPEMPMPMPNISMLRNLGSMDMPMPPPPMAFTSVDRTESEDQAISSMLLSWYMSGYYTGLYQGMKRAKGNRRDV